MHSDRSAPDWRLLPDAELDGFVDALARRLKNPWLQSLDPLTTGADAATLLTPASADSSPAPGCAITLVDMDNKVAEMAAERKAERIRLAS